MLKKIGSYFIIFIGLVVLLTSISTLINLIPKDVIKKNLIDSQKILMNLKKEEEKSFKFKGMSSDYKVDLITLKIVEKFNEDKPLASFLQAKFSNYKNPKNELIKNLDGNEYVRYWHRSNNSLETSFDNF